MTISDLRGTLEQVICLELEWDGSSRKVPSDSFCARRGSKATSVMAIVRERQWAEKRHNR
jgi:hypothetical protein